MPLATGIFLGAAAMEMIPVAWDRIGAEGLIWATTGLALFSLAGHGVARLGRQGTLSIYILVFLLHSILEASVIATGYKLNLTLGALLSAALVFHLLPEITASAAVFSILGLSVRKALVLALLILIAAVVVAISLSLFAESFSEGYFPRVLGFAAGGFLYVGYLSWSHSTRTIGKSYHVVLVGFVAMGFFSVLGHS